MQHLKLFEWSQAEAVVKEILKRQAGIREIMRPDWSGRHDIYGWIDIEVKEQERFESREEDGSIKKLGPEGGHGIDHYQVKRRLKKFEETGVRTWLWIKEIRRSEPEYCKWFHGFLDELIQEGYFITRNGKFVLPLRAFKEYNGPVPDVLMDLEECPVCGSLQKKRRHEAAK